MAFALDLENLRKQIRQDRANRASTASLSKQTPRESGSASVSKSTTWGSIGSYDEFLQNSCETPRPAVSQRNAPASQNRNHHRQPFSVKGWLNANTDTGPSGISEKGGPPPSKQKSSGSANPLLKYKAEAVARENEKKLKRSAAEKIQRVVRDWLVWRRECRSVSLGNSTLSPITFSDTSSPPPPQARHVAWASQSEHVSPPSGSLLHNSSRAHAQATPSNDHRTAKQLWAPEERSHPAAPAQRTLLMTAQRERLCAVFAGHQVSFFTEV